MNSLKGLHEKAVEIIERHFKNDTTIIHNITATTLITTYTKNNIHYAIGYFICIEGKNVFGNVDGLSFENVLEKLNAKCVFDKIVKVESIQDIEV